MKLRSIICVSAAVAAMSASAVLESGNTFARLKVNSALNNEIIAIPFAGCGATDAKIYVTNLVMTAGLANGDTLMYKDGDDWYAWEISAGNWIPLTIATQTSLKITPAAGSTRLDCGKACWLIRSNPGACYLYGQVNDTMPTSVEVAGATSGNAVAYTIIAKPLETNAVDLLNWHPSQAATGDTLLVPVATNINAMGQVTYKYDATIPAWTKATQEVTEKTSPRTGEKIWVTNTTWTAISESTTIPAGKGFMYGRKGAEGATLAW